MADGEESPQPDINDSESLSQGSQYDPYKTTLKELEAEKYIRWPYFTTYAYPETITEAGETETQIIRTYSRPIPLVVSIKADIPSILLEAAMCFLLPYLSLPNEGPRRKIQEERLYQDLCTFYMGLTESKSWAQILRNENLEIMVPHGAQPSNISKLWSFTGSPEIITSSHFTEESVTVPSLWLAPVTSESIIELTSTSESNAVFTELLHYWHYPHLQTATKQQLIDPNHPAITSLSREEAGKDEEARERWATQSILKLQQFGQTFENMLSVEWPRSTKAQQQELQKLAEQIGMTPGSEEYTKCLNGGFLAFITMGGGKEFRTLSHYWILDEHSMPTLLQEPTKFTMGARLAGIIIQHISSENSGESTTWQRILQTLYKQGTIVRADNKSVLSWVELKGKPTEINFHNWTSITLEILGHTQAETWASTEQLNMIVPVIHEAFLILTLALPHILQIQWHGTHTIRQWSPESMQIFAQVRTTGRLQINTTMLWSTKEAYGCRSPLHQLLQNREYHRQEKLREELRLPPRTIPLVASPTSLRAGASPTPRETAGKETIVVAGLEQMVTQFSKLLELANNRKEGSAVEETEKQLATHEHRGVGLKAVDRDRLMQSQEALKSDDRESLGELVQELLQRTALRGDDELIVDLFCRGVRMFRPEWVSKSARPETIRFGTSTKIANKLLSLRAAVCNSKMRYDQHREMDLDEVRHASLDNSQSLREVLNTIRIKLARLDTFYGDEFKMDEVKTQAARRLFNLAQTHPKYRNSPVVYQLRNNANRVTLEDLKDISDSTDSIPPATQTSSGTESTSIYQLSDQTLKDELKRKDEEMKKLKEKLEEEIKRRDNDLKKVKDELQNSNREAEIAEQIARTHREHTWLKDEMKSDMTAYADSLKTELNSDIQNSLVASMDNAPTRQMSQLPPSGTPQANSFAPRGRFNSANNPFMRNRPMGSFRPSQTSRPFPPAANRPSLPREAVDLEGLPVDLKTLVETRLKKQGKTMEDDCVLCGPTRRQHKGKDCGFLWSLSKKGIQRMMALRPPQGKFAITGNSQAMNVLVEHDVEENMYAQIQSGFGSCIDCEENDYEWSVIDQQMAALISVVEDKSVPSPTTPGAVIETRQNMIAAISSNDFADDCKDMHGGLGASMVRCPDGLFQCHSYDIDK